jgi:hypothetical protein
MDRSGVMINLGSGVVQTIAGGIALAVLLWCAAALSPALAEDGPSDPFDYNYCGGERVYPVIGVNFGTECGPRNQIALGRRGKLSWFFPSARGIAPRSNGTRKLDEAALAKLSLLAEAAQVSDSPATRAGRVMYRMGINFSGRRPRRVHTAMTEAYIPATKLLRAMLALVPDPPTLPECSTEPRIFDPTENRMIQLKSAALADR